jgi:hypothetical protein
VAGEHRRTQRRLGLVPPDPPSATEEPFGNGAELA